MAVTPPKIIICGCGPGSADYITPAARNAAARADVLIGAPRLLARFEECAAERINAGAHSAQVISVIEARRERRVAVLVSGDPGLSSLAQPLLRHFGREACEVIPGISSVQVAFARLGLEWSEARIISAHSRDPNVDAQELRTCDTIAVLAGREQAQVWIADLMDALGGEYRAFVCENLTMPDERVLAMDAAGLRNAKLASLAIVILLRRNAPA